MGMEIELVLLIIKGNEIFSDKIGLLIARNLSIIIKIQNLL